MNTSSPNRSRMPGIDELGRDLLQVTAWERVRSIMRPLLCVTAYFVFAFCGWWTAAVLSVAGLMFITYISTSHDLLHRTLGFSRTANELWLSLIELLVLRSGHAFRLTHLQHHRRFPEPDDVEGRVARKSWMIALLSGIGHQARLFLWAWPRARRDEKIWMGMELVGIFGFVVGSIVCFQSTPVPLIYVLLIITSSWLYPLATVWIPHRAEASDVFGQTLMVRGRWVPMLFLQHTYHLEHHLYPSVPSWRWRDLARRLDSFLRTQDVRLVEIP